MVEKLRNMSIAEMEDLIDLKLAVIAIRPAEQEEKTTWLDMLSDMRYDYGTDRVPDIGAGRALAMYNAQFAELHDDRMAEKSKVRNRRACERKARVKNPRYVKRNGGKFDRNVWYEGDKVFHWEDDLRMPERRMNSMEKSVRKDWEIDLEGIEYDIAYEEMAINSYEEDIDDLKQAIQNIEYELSDMESKRDHLEILCELVKKADGYIRDSKEFLRKYAYVKEMM